MVLSSAEKKHTTQQIHQHNTKFKRREEEPEEQFYCLGTIIVTGEPRRKRKRKTFRLGPHV
jgi:hypothetical protein